MARTFTRETVSPYYPPRARWYGRIFYLAGAVRRGIALDRICLPRELRWRELAAGFLVPGLAVWFRGPRVWGRATMMVCALLLAIFVVWLGYPVANLAFGLLISVHATGLVYYCGPLLNGWEFRWRIFFTVAVLLGVGLLLYSPARSALQNHWVTPVLRNGGVVVVKKFIGPAAVKRGDWVLYSLPDYSAGSPHGGGAVRVRAGYGWGPVLAVAGDRVTFSTNRFAVNGVNHPLRPHMPQSGELVVPEKDWFIWPELDISGHGNVGEAVISGTMLQLALVPENQFAGKPFHRWFWREQIVQ